MIPKLINRKQQTFPVENPFTKAAVVAAVIALPFMVFGHIPVSVSRILYCELLAWVLTGWFWSRASFGGKRPWVSITIGFLLFFILVNGGCHHHRAPERTLPAPISQYR